MAYVYIHNQENLKKIAEFASENAPNILGPNIIPNDGKWFSYVEEDTLAVVFVKNKDLPYTKNRLQEYRSPFPGLIAPKNATNSVAVRAKHGTIGFFNNNNVKDSYGFQLERGAGVVIANHIQAMVFQSSKGTLQNLSFQINLAVLYRPSEFDSEEVIKRKIIQLLSKLNNSGNNY